MHITLKPEPASPVTGTMPVTLKQPLPTDMKQEINTDARITFFQTMDLQLNTARSQNHNSAERHTSDAGDTKLLKTFFSFTPRGRQRIGR